MKTKLSTLNAEYLPGQKQYWTGRDSNPNIENQYWHQEIKLLDINNLNNQSIIDIGIIGYACDEGVRRNLGRPGAAKGPRAVRDRLAKLPIHFNTKRVADFGDVSCVEQDLESCIEAFSIIISELIAQKIFPIAIGGGHDMAFGHFMGLRKALKNASKKSIGIINFDAHFDLRPIEKLSNSGTPFNQIIAELEKTGEKIDYFAIGIQQQSNTKRLFDIAKTHQIKYAINYECEPSVEKIKHLQEQLKPLISNTDYLYITIDLDGFSSAYAPGVSAPSPLGFNPFFVFKMLDFLLDTKKVISCDIAELNPKIDRDKNTAILAARLVDFITMKHHKIVM
ncbi:formimidoylglutamase [Algibacter mikhailovii]|uniref:Formimidoylglutamase n=1 Tax=Algibacter mikhailovii TaxID=425498 RepID=A0A918VEF8_9FLAO|nr:formimidoylglutamase [Algibacter mikhailovii]GGZ91979.1 formimidoylglutamase [Algibacter mikhailovii]